MATVRDTGVYILRQTGPMSITRLQRLCYLAYGYHLAWESRPLFPEHFVAWASGPVATELHTRRSRQYEVKPTDIEADPTALDEGEKQSVDIVLEALLRHTTRELTQMVCGPPWQLARSRSYVHALAQSNEPLTNHEIAALFGPLT
ncbi:Panacea domain-containing protein [Streptomyces sp. NPDC001890]|uniref:Panacea domain-containing protein n=1 Tax=Streptomyces sp. NPDC001890 TaxID=3364620 RepID=UPI0036C751DA